MTRAQIAEVGRFLVVGCSAVGTDGLVYFAATHAAVAPWLAKTVSFAAGALVSFVFNRAFTFRAKGTVAHHALGFAVLYAVTLGLNVAVHAMSLRLGFGTALAWLVATGASTVANYAGMKFLVFADRGAVVGEST